MLDDVGRCCGRRLITAIRVVRAKWTVDVAILVPPASSGCAAIAAGVEAAEAAAAAFKAAAEAADEAGDDGEEDKGGDDDCDNYRPPWRQSVFLRPKRGWRLSYLQYALLMQLSQLEKVFLTLLTPFSALVIGLSRTQRVISAIAGILADECLMHAADGD